MSFDLGESGRLVLRSHCDKGTRALMAWEPPHMIRRFQDNKYIHWERVLDSPSMTAPLLVYVVSREPVLP